VPWLAHRCHLGSPARSATSSIRSRRDGAPSTRLDAACARALVVGDPAYRTVKGILAAGTEHEGTAMTTTMVSVPAHLRGSHGLFEDLDGDADDGEASA